MNCVSIGFKLKIIYQKKIGKSKGKVQEYCQPGKLGTMVEISPSVRVRFLFDVYQPLDCH